MWFMRLDVEGEDYISVALKPILYSAMCLPTNVCLNPEQCGTPNSPLAFLANHIVFNAALNAFRSYWSFQKTRHH